jgi:ribosomal protein S18 acetylase RimI-like enzyme
VIRCEDWRNTSADALQALYRVERARWMSHLHWDIDPTYRLLEEARTRGHAPGLIAVDGAGRPTGWAYYGLVNRMLQIGGLVAASGEVTRALLDGILRSTEADMASDLMCFAFPASPALESALVRQRFAITKYLYLSRELKAGSEPWRLRSAMRIAHWREMDAVMTVRLMARAYAGIASARVFAPRGTLEEWATYLAQLIKMPACGQFMPSASLAATESIGMAGSPGPRQDKHRQEALRGALIATTLQPDTAHIAQIVVDPSLRRRGLARDLIETTSAIAAAQGCTRITLLVAADNAPACALYAAAGFRQSSHFVYATRQAPNRMRGAVRSTRPSASVPSPLRAARF